MEYQNTRIAKLREYLFTILDNLLSSNKYQINANMLSNDINNYSLDKIPTASTIERWINGIELHRDVFYFRSRVAYSQDVINNLSNIGFFEEFESIINSNNEKGILPDIDHIESIRCKDSGSMVSATTNSAEFNIQIEITFRNK